MRRHLNEFVFVASVIALSFAASTAAAEPPHPPSPSVTPPGDIVRLKNGGLVRGTIVELVPSDSVTLLLVDGTTRKFTLSDTTYVGAASQDPRGASPRDPTWPGAGTAPYATIHAKGAHLSLEASQPNVTFHLQTSSAKLESGAGPKALGFERLCTAPCTIDVPEGAHHFALSRPDGDLVAAQKDIVVEGNETVRGTIVERHGLRLGGILLLSIGAPLGAGAIMLGAVLSSNPQSQAPAPLYVAGGIVAGVSLVFGTILVTRLDYVTLELQPGVAGVVPAPSTAHREAAEPRSGLTATVRF